VRLVRRADAERARVTFTLDGAPAEALAGDTLLTAILTTSDHVRVSEFGDGRRAGFCWMGACQDCFVRVDGLGRVRACATLLASGMAVRRA
jgi:predicted molibdopterin-dependent oxidoreductase YjgC